MPDPVAPPVPTSPGYRTSEGVLSGLVVALAPLLPAILGAQLSWQHVALFAVAGLVVAVFGVGRVVLKLRGLALLAVLLLGGCSGVATWAGVLLVTLGMLAVITSRLPPMTFPPRGKLPPAGPGVVVAVVLLLLLAPGCARYTATQGATCAAAVASSLQGSAHLVLDCRDAAEDHTDAAILMCIDDTLTQVARAVDAVPACTPPADSSTAAPAVR